MVTTSSTYRSHHHRPPGSDDDGGDATKQQRANKANEPRSNAASATAAAVAVVPEWLALLQEQVQVQANGNGNGNTAHNGGGFDITQFFANPCRVPQPPSTTTTTTGQPPRSSAAPTSNRASGIPAAPLAPQQCVRPCYYHQDSPPVVAANYYNDNNDSRNDDGGDGAETAAVADLERADRATSSIRRGNPRTVRREGAASSSPTKFHSSPPVSTTTTTTTEVPFRKQEQREDANATTAAMSGGGGEGGGHGGGNANGAHLGGIGGAPSPQQQQPQQQQRPEQPAPVPEQALPVTVATSAPIPPPCPEEDEEDDEACRQSRRRRRRHYVVAAVALVLAIAAVSVGIAVGVTKSSSKAQSSSTDSNNDAHGAGGDGDNTNTGTGTTANNDCGDRDDNSNDDPGCDAHHTDPDEQDVSQGDYEIGVPPGKRPNFVFIFSDDVGFGDPASPAYGHPYALTPNLDRLASEGTSFRQVHMTGNVCPISRAGLMTSRNPSWFPNYTDDFGFLGTLTLQQFLHDSGYTVGHIGKWNIGPTPDETDPSDPNRYGVDDLRLVGSIYGDPRGKEGLRFDEAIDFVEDHYLEDQPFYLNLWIYATHTPVKPSEELKAVFANLTVDRDLFGVNAQETFRDLDAAGGDLDEAMITYLAELYGMDYNIGRLLDKLDELGVADDTIVVFSSDNGPARINAGMDNVGWAGGLRGSKHTYYEGGTRVPFIVRWPGVVPAGKINDKSIMSGLDWFPTVGSLAQADVPYDIIEGEDMSDAWLGSDRSRTNPLFYRPLINHGTAFMRYGRWKLHKGVDELYDLEMDPFELENLYYVETEIRDAMLDSIEQWEATLPTVHVRLDDPANSTGTVDDDVELAPFDPTSPAIVIGPPNYEQEWR